MTLDRAPRVAIVGVRRVRTGLGQFFAKHLVAHGAVVPAFIGTRKDTIAEARALLAGHGISARGFTRLEDLLAAEPVDALVVASPVGTHVEWVRRAVDAGLHVLCEKPFALGAEVPAGGLFPMFVRAAERRLVVRENCPWPYALTAFDELHPAARREPVRSFAMELAPSAPGRAMLIDAMSHPLSLLQELAAGEGEPTIEELRFAIVERQRVEFSFRFVVQGRPIDASIRFRVVPEQPRPAAFTVNGFRADRRVRMNDYAMTLESDGRSVALPDPMQALVGEFVRSVRTGEDPSAARRSVVRIVARLLLLHEIVGSFPGL